MRNGRALLAALCVASVCTAGPAGAGRSGHRTFNVFPGRDAILHALERAGPGDVIRVHPGRYREVVNVDVRVTIKGVGRRIPTIDGRCETGVTINVLTDGVTLKRLRVQGATEGFGSLPSEVNASGVDNVSMRALVFKDTCDAEYGVNVFGAGKVVVAKSVARGFSDAGIYIGGIEQGPVFVERNEAFENNRGIIVEDSFPGTVFVRDNRIRNNDEPGTSASPSGIDLIRTDGVEVTGNTVRDNLVYGIRAYAEAANVSTDNLIFANVVSGSGTFDLFDEPNANCWNGTTYGTSMPNPPRSC